MKTISARHVADLLDVASRGVRSRQNRERQAITPKKVSSWLMNLVMDLDKADDWSEPDETKKEEVPNA